MAISCGVADRSISGLNTCSLSAVFRPSLIYSVAASIRYYPNFQLTGTCYLLKLTARHLNQYYLQFIYPCDCQAYPQKNVSHETANIDTLSTVGR